MITKMTKNEMTLLKIIGCCIFLINNTAYLQEYTMAKLDNPTVGKYNLDGILKYSKKTIKQMEKLMKELKDWR